MIALDIVLRGLGVSEAAKTDELDAGKCEGGGDEDGADALESVCIHSRVVPIHCTDVLAIRSARGTATTVKGDGDKYEHGDDEESETQRPEFLPCASKCPKNVDRGDRELQHRRSEIDSQDDSKVEKTHVEDGNPRS